MQTNYMVKASSEYSSHSSKTLIPSISLRVTGLILVLISAVVFSTAGIFTKGVTADAWAVIFWRGLFATGFTLIYIAFKGTLKQETIQMGKPGLAAAIISALGTVAFIPAFKLTSIANVSLIYAAAPFVAAILAWIWMRERPSLIVIISSVVAFAGVALIVSGSFGGLNIKGDLLALWMTLMMATVIVIYRRYPQTPGPGPMTLSSIFLLPIALFFGDPLSAPINEIPIMASFGLVFAVASVTLVLGARYLPSSETALISLMEAPLAILLAWLIFSEIPVNNTIIGGIVIMLAVFCSQVLVKKDLA